MTNDRKKVKKFAIIIVIVLIVLLLVDFMIVAISDVSESRNDEWGLRLSVSEVSSEGASILLEREESGKRDELMVSPEYSIEKRCFFSWRELKYEGEQVFLAVAPILEEGKEYSLKADWEYRCGKKLSPGIYRVGGITEGIELYKTFIVFF